MGWDGPTGWGTPDGALLLALVAPAVDGGMPDAAIEAGEVGEDAASDATAIDATVASDASEDATLENDAAMPDDSGIGRGDGEAGGDGGNGPAGGSSGCGCTTASSPRGGSSGLTLLALVALLLVRRATRAGRPYAFGLPRS